MSKEAIDTTQKANENNIQDPNSAGTPEETAKGAEEYLGKVFNPENRELDASSQATAARHTEEVNTEEIKTESVSAAETEKGKTQETKKQENSEAILKLDTEQGEAEFNLNNPEELQKLIESTGDGKIELEIDGKKEEFDLTNEEGINKLKEAIGQTAGEDEITGDNILEIKVNETVEKFDMSKAEDREKVKQFAQKGRFFEKEREQQIKEKETLEAEKLQLSTFGESVGHAILFNMTQGKFDKAILQEKPYNHFLNLVEDTPEYENLTYAEKEAKATELWNKDNDTKAGLKQNLREFETNYKKTAQQYAEMLTEFQKKHPEFKDLKEVVDWVGKNVGPYSAPILTYGAEQYPADMLEMVYFWKNKDVLLKHAESNGAKRYAKAKIIKQTDSSKILNNDTPATKAEDKVRSALNPAKLKIVH